VWAIPPRTAASFRQRYLSCAQPAGFLPHEPIQRRTLLNAYLLEKALYELRYGRCNHPDWVQIPLKGVLQLVN
jgi:maltose alpha-D-glucosyltransferase/alpha-amylase